MNPDFEVARRAFFDGLASQQAGQLAQAESHYRLSLTFMPGRASTLSNLGAVLLALARPHEALPLLEQATQAQPDLAEGWLQRADTLAQLGRLADALPCIDRLLALQPTLALGWARRGALLKDLGRGAAAADALQRAIELGADPQVNGYLLASLTGTQAPPQAPRDYVEQLFDSYADGFDHHLVQQLQYRAPEALVRLLRQQGRQFQSALDLGCGTGLCGPLLRPLTRQLTGVDLSSCMLAQARLLGVYDELLQADIAQHLQDTSHRHDLLLAADVFIYIGDLAAVFSGAACVLQPGGLFGFSVERAADSVDFELRPSSRYAQSERHLRELALRQGLQVVACTQETLRLDQRQPVAGLCVLLRSAG